jgi:hypothetical protein
MKPKLLTGGGGSSKRKLMLHAFSFLELKSHGKLSFRPARRASTCHSGIVSLVRHVNFCSKVGWSLKPTVHFVAYSSIRFGFILLLHA